MAPFFWHSRPTTGRIGIFFMDDRRGQVHATTNEARGGSTPHIVRWVLGVSLLAAIVLLSLVWMTGAAVTDQSQDQANVADRANASVAADRAAETTGSTTDSIVSDGADEFGTQAGPAPNSTQVAN
jgi:hypothetical protein